MVEDSDPEEKILNGKVWKAWKLYEDDLGIPALDDLFILDLDPMAVITSWEDKNKNNGEGLESTGNEGEVLVGGEDVEMAEVVNAIGGSDA